MARAIRFTFSWAPHRRCFEMTSGFCQNQPLDCWGLKVTSTQKSSPGTGSGVNVEDPSFNTETRSISIKWLVPSVWLPWSWRGQSKIRRNPQWSTAIFNLDHLFLPSKCLNKSASKMYPKSCRCSGAKRRCKSGFKCNFILESTAVETRTWFSSIPLIATMPFNHASWILSRIRTSASGSSFFWLVICVWHKAIPTAAVIATHLVPNLGFCKDLFLGDRYAVIFGGQENTTIRGEVHFEVRKRHGRVKVQNRWNAQDGIGEFRPHGPETNSTCKKNIKSLFRNHKKFSISGNLPG